MKKTLLGALILLAGLCAAGVVVLPMLGLSVTDLGANVRVGTALGAKLACSGRYLSGLDEQQVSADLASYTPVTRLLNFRYDDAQHRVSTNMLGMGAIAARYREGLGCTLEIGDTTPLDVLRVAPLSPSSAMWPAGGSTATPHAPLQREAARLLAQDNAAGQQTRALLVVHRGRIAAEVYAPGFTADTPLLGWSMGKSLTAILFGQMEMQGLVAVEERDLFASWHDDARAQISIENLLHMASGLAFAEVYAPGSDATAMLFGAHNAAAVALRSPLAYAPGTHWAYSSGTTNILAQLATRRLGGPQATLDWITQRLLAPLGMRHTVVEVDPSGVFVGSSYVYASARDWARLGQLMLNEGVLNGTRIVTPDWVARARTPASSRNEQRYGYQFWLNSAAPTNTENLRWPQLPADVYAMRGNRAQNVMIVPSADTVIVRLGWSAKTYPIAERVTALLAVLPGE